MHSYIGALISMVVLLLTVDHWTFDVVAFPLFVVCMATVQSILVGLEPGPRLVGPGTATPPLPARPPAEGMTP